MSRIFECIRIYEVMSPFQNVTLHEAFAPRSWNNYATLAMVERYHCGMPGSEYENFRPGHVISVNIELAYR